MQDNCEIEEKKRNLWEIQTKVRSFGPSLRSGHIEMACMKAVCIRVSTICKILDYQKAVQTT